MMIRMVLYHVSRIFADIIFGSFSPCVPFFIC